MKKEEEDDPRRDPKGHEKKNLFKLSSILALRVISCLFVDDSFFISSRFRRLKKGEDGSPRNPKGHEKKNLFKLSSILALGVISCLFVDKSFFFPSA
ncbi:MAG: hypothetical protein A2V67_20070 [Deltaproteobacteria bacterium RBG_13_61_14]|nr:MAG: hypothetical protein A2V67_20070 [Deltaproteobacteria bacterium RBG_13_61_14]